MRYHIISINDERQQYKDEIHRVMSLAGVKRTRSIKSINGSNISWNKNHEAWNINPELLLGEIGVWFSNFEALNFCAEVNEPLIVFEDDAQFLSKFHMNWIDHLPEDWDYVSLWTPDNQYADITYNVQYDAEGVWHEVPVGQGYNYYIDNHYFAKAYQGYGGVATVYSPQGAKKIYEQAKIDGIREPYDTWLHTLSHLNRVNGYSLKPSQQIMWYDWVNDQTQVHNTPRLKTL